MRQALQSVASLLMVFAIAYALKQHYSVATSNDLLWVLQPTASIVALVLQTPFVFEPEYGFISTLHEFAIEPSCAGINFMIAAFTTISLLWLPNVTTIRHKFAVICGALVASFAATIAVNSLRITSAVALGNGLAEWFRVSEEQFHRIEGITVYLVGLFIVSAAASRFQRRWTTI